MVALYKKNIFFEKNNCVLYNGNALEVLKNIPDNSVDCVVTSPHIGG